MHQPNTLWAGIALAVAMTGLSTQAQAAGAKADFDYAQIMAMVEAAGGDPVKVTGQVAGKTVALHLKRIGGKALMVEPKDGLFFVCTQGDDNFKGGDVVLKMVKFSSSDDTEPTIVLENCAALQ